MIRNILTSIIILLITTSCGDKETLEHIEGNYYMKRSTSDSLLNEPSYSSLELVYRNSSTKKDNFISKGVGEYGGDIYTDFSWKVYGPNIAYVKFVKIKGGFEFHLYVYSPYKGNILIDKRFNDYWKVEATSKWIRCLPYDVNGEHSETVTPVVYTAKYLSGLGTVENK